MLHTVSPDIKLRCVYVCGYVWLSVCVCLCVNVTLKASICAADDYITMKSPEFHLQGLNLQGMNK